jgi:hypothetical protein
LGEIQRSSALVNVVIVGERGARGALVYMSLCVRTLFAFRLLWRLATPKQSDDCSRHVSADGEPNCRTGASGKQMYKADSIENNSTYEAHSNEDPKFFRPHLFHTGNDSGRYTDDKPQEGCDYGNFFHFEIA